MRNLTNPEYIKQFFKHHGFRPKDYMGQNFLVDETVLGKIIAAAKLTDQDTVLEVGPGLGVLTEELVKKAHRVIAVEKDKKLFKLLNYELRITNSKSAIRNIQLINQDILHFNLEKEIIGSYKVVANIPYYLTSHLIQVLLTAKHKPALIVLLVQKEVAERMTAVPGEMSLLGVSVQFFSQAEIISTVSRASFWPEPEVDSAIIKFEPKNKFPQVKDEQLFFRIVKAGFAGKRKQLHNTLSAGLHLNKNETNFLLEQSGISPDLRAQNLSLTQWVGFYENYIRTHLD